MRLFRPHETEDSAIVETLVKVANELSSVTDWEHRLVNVLSILSDAFRAQWVVAGLAADEWRLFCNTDCDDLEEVADLVYERYRSFSAAGADALMRPGSLWSSAQCDQEPCGVWTLPVINSGEVVGVLHVYAQGSDQHSFVDTNTLTVVAAHLGSYIRNVRTRNHKELAKDVHRYRGLLEAVLNAVSSGIVVSENPDGRISLVNKRAMKLYGKEQEEGLTVPNSVESFRLLRADGSPYPSEELPLSRALKRDEDVRNVEVVIEQPDGAHVAAAATALPIHDNQGNVTAAVGVFEGISARVCSETQRRAAELQSVVSSLTEGVVHFDTHGNIVSMNEASRKILRMPAGQPGGNWLTDYVRHSLDGEPIPTRQVAAYRALLGEVVRDVRFKMITPWGQEVTLNVGAAPIRDPQGQIIGATNILRDVSESLALDQEREQVIEREKHIADVLQQALIPPDLPSDLPGSRIATAYQPALNEAEVGGDFYDVFEIGPRKYGVLIGDVAGKGLSAAIRVAAARYAIRSYAYLDPVPAKVMTYANEALCRGSVGEFGLLTALFAVVDVQAGEITYSSAGHEPPVICDESGCVEELDKAGGRALGIMGDYIYSQSSRRLHPGNRIVMITDGITEARREGRLLGKEGVRNFVTANCRRTPKEIASGLLDTARVHAGGFLQDDAAIIVIEIGGPW